MSKIKNGVNSQITNLSSPLREMGKQKMVVYSGLLIALYIALYYCNIIITPTIQFRLGFLAIAAAGMVGGPLMGLSVGVLGDLLSMILTGGMGASFFFGFTLSYALMGLLFGFIFCKKQITIKRAILGAFGEFFISIFLNTYWLSILYGTPYQAQFLVRLPKSILMFFVTAALLYFALEAIQTAIKKTGLLYR